jgi:hypothetical protein
MLSSEYSLNIVPECTVLFGTVRGVWCGTVWTNLDPASVVK